MTFDLGIWAPLAVRFRAEVFARVFMPDWNEGLVLSPQSLRLLSERGLALGLDICGSADDA